MNTLALWIGILLYALGNSFAVQPPVTHHQKLVAVPEERNGLRRRPALRPFTYVFSGKAMNRQTGYPEANVVARLTSSQESVTQSAITHEDGSYEISVTIWAKENEPVDWELSAYGKDFRRLNMTGRRIMMREAEPILVNTPLQIEVF